MKHNFRITELLSENKIHCDEVRVLFKALYSFLSKQGLKLKPVPKADEIWLQSVLHTLSVSGKVFLAIQDEKVIGFAQGILRFTPPYFGEELTGSIMHFYVSPASRRNGAGKKLLEAIEDWFASRKVQSIDLQVTHLNKDGHAFWSAMGYADELIQMRKLKSSL